MAATLAELQAEKLVVLDETRILSAAIQCASSACNAYLRSDGSMSELPQAETRMTKRCIRRITGFVKRSCIKWRGFHDGVVSGTMSWAMRSCVLM